MCHFLNLIELFPLLYKVFIVLQKRLPKPNLWSVLNPTSIEWHHMQCDECLSSAVTRALAVIAFCTITIKSLYFYLFAIQYVVSWYLSCNWMYSLQLYYMLIPTFHQYKSAAVKSSVDGGLESWQEQERWDNGAAGNTVRKKRMKGSLTSHIVTITIAETHQWHQANCPTILNWFVITLVKSINARPLSYPVVNCNVVYTSTPLELHLRGNYCTFNLTTFVWHL